MTKHQTKERTVSEESDSLCQRVRDEAIERMLGAVNTNHVELDDDGLRKHLERWFDAAFYTIGNDNVIRIRP